MKATKRQNGEMMFTTKVDFHIGRSDIVETFIVLAPDYPKGRREAMKETVSRLMCDGFDWQSGASDTAYAQAEAAVDALFPELCV